MSAKPPFKEALGQPCPSAPALLDHLRCVHRKRPEKLDALTTTPFHLGMCNLYSNTTAQEAMRQLFDVVPGRDHLGNAEPKDAIYPKHMAPVVRLDEDGERELVELSWGFRTTNKSKKTGNIISPAAWNNARDDKVATSGLWKGSFEHRRCLVPASSFCEAKGRNPAT